MSVGRATVDDSETPAASQSSHAEDRTTTRSPRPRVRWVDIVPCLALYAGSRIATVCVAWMAKSVVGTSLSRVLAPWDSGWYISVLSGYAHRLPPDGPGFEQSNLAFFPGHPLATKAVMTLTGLSAVTSSIVAATIAGAAAVVVLYLIADQLAGRATALRTVALFSFFPGAYALSYGYPEALFVLASAACLLCLLQRRWALAGLAGAVAGLARPNGIFLAACCAIAAFEAIRRRRELRSLLAPAIAPLGTLGFFFYLWRRTGDFLVWPKAQKQGWGQNLDFGAGTIDKIGKVVHHPLADFNLLVATLSLLFVVIACVLMWKMRLPLTLWVFTASIIGPLVISEAFPLTPRSVLIAFPLLLAVAHYARGPWFTVVIASSAMLLAGLTFVTGTSIMLTA